jgi:hypothetical protein
MSFSESFGTCPTAEETFGLFHRRIGRRDCLTLLFFRFLKEENRTCISRKKQRAYQQSLLSEQKGFDWIGFLIVMIKYITYVFDTTRCDHCKSTIEMSTVCRGDKVNKLRRKAAK